MRHLLNFSVCLISLLGTVSIANSESFKKVICIGEIEHNCPFSRDLFYQAHSDIHGVAKEICTVWGTDGKQVPGRYRLEHIDSKPGNCCGYEQYRITCLDT
jgi:hypothetical protein